jgi:hypothetical protein
VPSHPFDAYVLQPGQVDKYQTVRFDGNSYSVPRRYAFRPVTIKGYVDRVAVVADGHEIAAHARCYGHREKVLDPLHFLVILERKPAALDHAPVYRDWQLPAAFAELRHDLEARLGRATGARHFIRVLQLLAHHSVSHVEQAITACRGRTTLDAPAISAAVERSTPEFTPIAAVAMPLPNLSRFNGLLSYSSNGDHADERCHAFAAEGQPETTETADHPGRA